MSRSLLLKLPMLATLLFLGSAVAAGTADAGYVRTHTGGSGGEGPGGGHCLRWPGGATVTFQVEACSAGQSGPSCAARQAAIRQSLSAWKAVLDGCGSLSLVEGTPTSSRQVGYVPGAASNENVVLFRYATCGSGVASGGADCWDGSPETLGLTTTTFKAQTGVILDTDIELNAAQFVFSTVDAPPCPPDQPSTSCVANDVQNAVTHELGHALGLDHVDDPLSTMHAHASVGELQKRLIDAASAQAMCDIYPAGGPSQDCVAQSQGQSLESEGATLVGAVGCLAAGDGGRGGGGRLAIGLWIVLGLWLWRARRAGCGCPIEG